MRNVASGYEKLDAVVFLGCGGLLWGHFDA